MRNRKTVGIWKLILVAAVIGSLLTGAVEHADADGMPGKKYGERGPSSKDPMPASIILNPASWILKLQKKDSSIIVDNGITFVSVQRLASMFTDLLWESDYKAGLVRSTGPNHTLSWPQGSQQAVVNGGMRSMSGAALLKNGSFYLPLRDVVNWSGASMMVKKQGEVIIRYTISSMRAGSEQQWFWVRRDNGIIYTSTGSEMPHWIGQTRVRAFEEYSIKAVKLAEDSTMLSIIHNYGPEIMEGQKWNSDRYRMIVYRGKLVRQSFVHFFGTHPFNYVEMAEGYAVFLDGNELQVVKPDGSLKQRINLKWSMDDSGYLYDVMCTVEYVSPSEGLALIKPNLVNNMLLIDFRTKKAVELYQELLTEDEVTILDKWKTPSDMGNSGDQIEFVRRDGNVLVFKHRNLVVGTVSELRYTWK
ncbi:stalk domain-containing protein [Paenibacillus albus]|uniref:Copper amine oxidase-like N-terminal domain-containing protein n=1 Tax=Paenibacillus albus TaxID=2495582 RepID=A0A3Q8X779_9BACL|nr:hypothetical protein [Paenibacillus albus]AZN41617.1 hypothetical protein EJC50_19500 [Paenibacillus albus]